MLYISVKETFYVEPLETLPFFAENDPFLSKKSAHFPGQNANFQHCTYFTLILPVSGKLDTEAQEAPLIKNARSST